MSYGVGRKRGLDPVLLWPAAMALIRPLAWEPPYAASVGKKREKEPVTNIATFTKNKKCRSSHRGTAEMNPTRNHEVLGAIPWPRSVA